MSIFCSEEEQKRFFPEKYKNYFFHKETFLFQYKLMNKYSNLITKEQKNVSDLTQAFLRKILFFQFRTIIFQLFVLKDVTLERPLRNIQKQFFGSQALTYTFTRFSLFFICWLFISLNPFPFISTMLKRRSLLLGCTFFSFFWTIFFTNQHFLTRKLLFFSSRTFPVNKESRLKRKTLCWNNHKKELYFLPFISDFSGLNLLLERVHNLFTLTWHNLSKIAFLWYFQM